MSSAYTTHLESVTEDATLVEARGRLAPVA
jgi:hypothetical protein